MHADGINYWIDSVVPYCLAMKLTQQDKIAIQYRSAEAQNGITVNTEQAMTQNA